MADGIHVATTELGEVLVDGDGFSLYLFVPDGTDASSCFGDCATAWPPLGVEAVGTPGAGIDPALLGEITRDDGTAQASYNGKPLYLFSGDRAAGDTNGQGINDVWFLMGADGAGIGIPAAEETDIVFDY